MQTHETLPDAKTLQREYLREWRKRNPDKVKAYNRAYWERKAKKKAEGKRQQTEGNEHGER